MRPIPLEGVQYRRATSLDLVEGAKKCEFDIFTETGYPGTRGCLEEYEGLPCIFYVALDEKSEVVGVVRKILQSPLGFSVNHMTITDQWSDRIREIVRNERCEELATTALRKGFRGRNNFSCVLSLFRMAYHDAVESGVDWWLAPIEPPVLMHYSTTFHFNFTAIGEAQDYLGAPTIPAILNLKEGFEHMKKADPELAAFILEGISS